MSIPEPKATPTPAEIEKLVEEYLPYVKALALRIRGEISGQKLDVDELVAYGSRGLVEAAQRFDASRGVAFKTFSYYRIRGAIFDGLREMGWLNRYEYARSQEQLNNYMENESARDGAEGAARDKSAEETLGEISQTLNHVTTIVLTSFEASSGFESADESAEAADTQLEKTQALGIIRTAIHALPEKERDLLEMTYFRGFSLKDAGERLGMSKSWASRLHARAIEQLTAQLGPVFGLAPGS